MGAYNPCAWAEADTSNQDEGSSKEVGRENTIVGVEAVVKVREYELRLRNVQWV